MNPSSPYVDYLVETGMIEPKASDEIKKAWPDETARRQAARRFLEGKKRLLRDVTGKGPGFYKGLIGFFAVLFIAKCLWSLIAWSAMWAWRTFTA